MKINGYHNYLNWGKNEQTLKAHVREQREKERVKTKIE